VLVCEIDGVFVGVGVEVLEPVVEGVIEPEDERLILGD